MAVNYSTDLKNARLQAVADAVNGGTIEICSAGYAAVLAVLTLPNPSGTVADGVLTFDTSPALADTSADNSGTAAVARVKDSLGNVEISGLTVGETSENIVLTSADIVSGDSVTITSATITHAA
jgi:protein involved in polysaccharide export with SLBB domain